MIGNVITSVLLLIASVYIYIESIQMPMLGGLAVAGPSFFPLCCAAFFTVTAVILMGTEIYRVMSGKYGTEEISYFHRELYRAAQLKNKISSNMRGLFRMILIPALMIAYGIALRPVGFEISTWIFLDLTMLVCGEKRWKRLVFIPAAAIAFVYLIFVRFLRVSVPMQFL